MSITLDFNSFGWNFGGFSSHKYFQKSWIRKVFFYFWGEKITLNSWNDLHINQWIRFMIIYLKFSWNHFENSIPLHCIFLFSIPIPFTNKVRQFNVLFQVLNSFWCFYFFFKLKNKKTKAINKSFPLFLWFFKIFFSF